MISIEFSHQELYSLWKILTIAKLGGGNTPPFNSDYNSIKDMLERIEEKIIERQAKLGAKEE